VICELVSFVMLVTRLDCGYGLSPPLTILASVQLDNEIVNSLTLSTDLPQVDPCTSESSTTDIVGVLFLLGLQGVKVWFDGQRNNSRRVVGQVLLQRCLVHGLLVHGLVVREWKVESEWRDLFDVPLQWSG
jgi:hypothetical protein